MLESLIDEPDFEWLMINASHVKVHHAKLLAEFLTSNPRLQLMFLPPYSPDLNIIEGLWGWLKDSCINNVFFSKVYEINLAVRKFVDFVNQIPDIVIDRLCVQM